MRQYFKLGGQLILRQNLADMGFPLPGTNKAGLESV